MRLCCFKFLFGRVDIVEHGWVFSGTDRLRYDLKVTLIKTEEEGVYVMSRTCDTASELVATVA